jgi:hypothetical protein
VTSISRFGPSTYDQWRVKFAFAPTPDTTREGTAYLYGSDVKSLETGSTATVLVDPADPKKFEMYRAAARLYRIVVDPAST